MRIELIAADTVVLSFDYDNPAPGNNKNLHVDGFPWVEWAERARTSRVSPWITDDQYSFSMF